jgi:hypothetical protein
VADLAHDPLTAVKGVLRLTRAPSSDVRHVWRAGLEIIRRYRDKMSGLIGASFNVYAPQQLRFAF